MALIGSLGLLFGSPAVWSQASDPDLNNDGVVNILDVSVVSSCFGQDPGANPQCQVADTDGDGDVDFDDLMFVTASFGQTGFPIEEEDTIPPVVTAPGDITVAAVDSSGTPASDPAIAAFLSGASAADNVDGAITPINNAPAIFPVGVILVTFTATDAAGNTGSATATVTVAAPPEDATSPSLSITSPVGGSFVIQNQPTIQISFSDDTGVDTGSLTFSTNGDALGVDCQLTDTGGSCTPTTPLPEGSILLEASVDDLAGNTGSTQVQFIVDSLPVEINISSPADGLITKDAEIEVTGTVGSDVDSVTVNGVPATFGSGFSATVPLREGTNMIVAVATKASGRTGTDSVDVTRDIFAPIVRIDSPRDGFISVNDEIAVTGRVNDIVNGATVARVFVNGIEATVADGGFMVMDIPLVRGPNTIEAVATDAVGNEGRHAITVTFQEPVGARIGIASGNGQAELIQQALSDPLVAVVTDDLGNPVAARVVRFEVTRNNGTLKLSNSDTPKRIVEVPTDGSGRASALFTLGDTSGEGNNRVRVTGLGVAGEVEFCASAIAAPADKILMVMGDNQRGVVGHPLATPLEALVVDRDGNPIKDVPVTFTVVKGTGNLNGEQSLERVTGVDGIARAVLTLGPEPGINNNVVNASFPELTRLPATFVASGLLPGNPEDTRFSGVVLDNGHTPIPGAVVTIPDIEPPISATTDNQGQFLLEGVPVGHINLLIDPTNSPRPETFPPLHFETVTIAGQTNILGQPILLPALDTESSRIVGGSEDVTIKMTGVAGLELTVFANSVTCPEGTPDRSPDGKQCGVTISQVHLDKVPMPPPSGTIFMPPAWTIQPAGLQFDPPARISIPNDGLPPGRVIDIFQFDHTLNEFINVGKGTVSEDGLVIVSDPGFGITRAGWGGGGPPPPPTTCGSSCSDGNRCTTDNCVLGFCVNIPVPFTAPTLANNCESCILGFEVPPKTDDQCCSIEKKAAGYVVCCNGKKLSCLSNAFDGASVWEVEERKCATKHENVHHNHITCPVGIFACKSSRPPFKDGQDPGAGECEAYTESLSCLRAVDCKGDASCKTSRAVAISFYLDPANAGKMGITPGCLK